MSERENGTEEAGDALANLLEQAQRAANVGMLENDAARVWARITQGRRRRTPRVWLIASAAAALTMVAGLAGSRRPRPIEIVNEVSFESVHDGQVVRFEMTVYRESKKEKADADKPSL
jgi:hypothetical protein